VQGLVALHTGSTLLSVAGSQECRIPCSNSPHFEPQPLVAVGMTRPLAQQKWPGPARVGSAAAGVAFLSDVVHGWAS